MKLTRQIKKNKKNLQPLPFPFLFNESTAVTRWRHDILCNTTKRKNGFFFKIKTVTALRTDR